MKGHVFLKVTGILMIIAAAFSIIVGVLLAGISALAAGLGAASGLKFTFWAALFLTLVGGICQLIAGIKGIKHSKRSEKAGKLIAWGVIVAVFSILSIVLDLSNGGDFSIVSVVTGVAVPALYIYGCSAQCQGRRRPSQQHNLASMTQRQIGDYIWDCSIKSIATFAEKRSAILGNRKLENGNLCKNCARKLSPWFSDRRGSTVEEIRAQLAYRAENQEKVAAFHTTRTLGADTKVLLDEDAGKFMVTRARNLAGGQPGRSGLCRRDRLQPRH